VALEVFDYLAISSSNIDKNWQVHFAGYYDCSLDHLLYDKLEKILISFRQPALIISFCVDIR